MPELPDPNTHDRITTITRLFAKRFVKGNINEKGVIQDTVSHTIATNFANNSIKFIIRTGLPTNSHPDKKYIEFYATYTIHDKKGMSKHVFVTEMDVKQNALILNISNILNNTIHEILKNTYEFITTRKVISRYYLEDYRMKEVIHTQFQNMLLYIWNKANKQKIIPNVAYIKKLYFRLPFDNTENDEKVRFKVSIREDADKIARNRYIDSTASVPFEIPIWSADTTRLIITVKFKKFNNSSVVEHHYTQ